MRHCTAWKATPCPTQNQVPLRDTFRRKIEICMSGFARFWAYPEYSAKAVKPGRHKVENESAYEFGPQIHYANTGQNGLNKPCTKGHFKSHIYTLCDNLLYRSRHRLRITHTPTFEITNDWD